MADVFNFYVKDNREIEFSIAEPIMREDTGVTDWWFRIPKTINNIDMSSWAWWLVYVNAKGVKYTESLTLTADENDPDHYMNATYTVDYGMSIKAGTVRFAVAAKTADSGGTVTGEWHTETYHTKVKETLQGNQVEFAETESDIITALIVQIQTKYAQLVGGAVPLPVSSTSDMTDTTTIYLNTTDGCWYYYDGSDWVSGGTYGAGTIDQTPTEGSTNAISSGAVYDVQQTIPTVDDTLTTTGAAADAKKTGDEISGLKEDLEQLESAVAAISFDIVVDAAGHATIERSDLTDTSEVSY